MIIYQTKLLKKWIICIVIRQYIVFGGHFEKRPHRFTQGGDFADNLIQLAYG